MLTISWGDMSRPALHMVYVAGFTAIWAVALALWASETAVSTTIDIEKLATKIQLQDGRCLQIVARGSDWQLILTKTSRNPCDTVADQQTLPRTSLPRTSDDGLPVQQQSGLVVSTTAERIAVIFSYQSRPAGLARCASGLETYAATVSVGTTLTVGHPVVVSSCRNDRELLNPELHWNATGDALEWTWIRATDDQDNAIGRLTFSP